MSAIKNAERFTGRVEVYERFRMRYPQCVQQLIYERCGLTADQVVADIGAGTGMLAELFLEAGNPVIAVEPNADMRAACERLLPRFAKLKVVNAAAETTGLPAASVALVTVGRAFHWFDQPRAIAEFMRILEPGGWVVLVSNRRAAEGSEQMREYEQTLRDYGNDYDGAHERSRRTATLDALEGEHFRVVLPGEQRLTFEELAGQTESYSVAPKAGDANYEAMQDALRTFFKKWSVDGLITMDTACEVAGWRASLAPAQG